MTDEYRDWQESRAADRMLREQDIIQDRNEYVLGALLDREENQ